MNMKEIKVSPELLIWAVGIFFACGVLYADLLKIPKIEKKQISMSECIVELKQAQKDTDEKYEKISDQLKVLVDFHITNGSARGAIK